MISTGATFMQLHGMLFSWMAFNELKLFHRQLWSILFAWKFMSFFSWAGNWEKKKKKALCFSTGESQSKYLQIKKENPRSFDLVSLTSITRGKEREKKKNKQRKKADGFKTKKSGFTLNTMSSTKKREQ